MTPAPGAPGPRFGAADFTLCMDRLGPFESKPHMAAGVSGGADSMALAVLMSQWTRARGGRLTALIVDHGLRAAAAAEARSVGRSLGALGIEHRVLRWRGPVPKANIQAQARRIRHDLLSAWCARNGVLHLALGHHREDQAETFLLRLGRGSGLDGLAAMAGIGAGAQLRLLRPLLAVPKAHLVSLLCAADIGWIEDPANRDSKHARVRIRALAPRLAAEGLSAERLGATAAHLSRARRALETYTAELLARAVWIHPAGFARLDAALLKKAPEEVALRALARIFMAVGGLDYGPRLDRLKRLLDGLRAGTAKGRTLGRCRIMPQTGPPPHLLVVREQRGVPETPLQPGSTVLWDQRFEVALAARGQGRPVFVSALGRAGWTALRPRLADPETMGIPGLARPSLPAFWDRSGLLAVPHLGYSRTGPRGLIVSKCRFRPKNSLTGGAFTVA